MNLIVPLSMIKCDNVIEFLCAISRFLPTWTKQHGWISNCKFYWKFKRLLLSES